MTAKFVQPDFTTQDPTAYKGSIDAGFAVAKRIAMAFAPHAQDTPDMSVRVDAGQLFDGATLTEVAAQSTGTITAPVSDPRIDRVVIDAATGVVSVITGSENASPSPPSITAGKLPVAQVLLQTDSAAITNSMITDERTLTGSGGFGARTSIASAATVSLASVTSHNALITGTTTISSFGTSGANNPLYFVTFQSSLTITYGASLGTPGSVDITTAAGDSAIVEDLGSNQWRIRAYFKAAGLTKGDVGLGNVQNVDQTNAANITSGTLDGARLPMTVGAVGTYMFLTRHSGTGILNPGSTISGSSTRYSSCQPEGGYLASSGPSGTVMCTGYTANFTDDRAATSVFQRII